MDENSSDKLCADHIERLNMIEDMASFGQAPKRGCSLFDVGYEDTVKRISDAYLKRRFERGRSAEKFIVGPYGSGKTHLLRVISEAADNLGCVTSEVSLNKDVDFTNPLTRYREVVRELRCPGSDDLGIKGLLDRARHNIENSTPGNGNVENFVNAWIMNLENRFTLKEYGRVLATALKAMLSGDVANVEAGVRWLSGDFRERSLCKSLDVSVVTRNEEKLFGMRAMHSLFQFIKLTRFKGTVVGYDEAEQSLRGSTRKRIEIQTMLQMEINAIADLKGGSALVLFAVLDDVIDDVANFPALQQRLADPGGQSFYSGATLAPQIRLSEHVSLRSPEKHLMQIGERITELVYEDLGAADCEWCLGKFPAPKSGILDFAKKLSTDVTNVEFGGGGIRRFVKAICLLLVHIDDGGSIDNYGPNLNADHPESEF